MNSGATAERVYDALKAMLLSGDMPPDTRLEPAALADQLISSATPVRDALHRLAGERLVETRPGEGFRLPAVNEPGLRDLYRWNDETIRTIMRSWPNAVPRAPSDLPVDLARATPALFRVIAQRSANLEHAAAVVALNDRLAAARAAEARVMGDLEDELRALAVALDRSPRAALGRQITAYHRRRVRAAPNIVRALYHL